MRSAGQAPPRRARAWPVPSACAVLTVIYVWLGDVSVVGECVTVWPPILWALLLLPRVFWLWLSGARRAAALAAACVAAFVLTTTETASLFRVLAPSGQGQGLPVRVVTWNVAGGAPYAALEALRPDVVFVQESGGPPGRDAAWRGYQWFGATDPAVLTRWPARVLPTARVGPWTEPQLLVADLPLSRIDQVWGHAGHPGQRGPRPAARRLRPPRRPGRPRRALSDRVIARWPRDLPCAILDQEVRLRLSETWPMGTCHW